MFGFAYANVHTLIQCVTWHYNRFHVTCHIGTLQMLIIIMKKRRIVMKTMFTVIPPKNRNSLAMQPEVYIFCLFLARCNRFPLTQPEFRYELLKIE